MLKAFERVLTDCKPPGLHALWTRPSGHDSNERFRRTAFWIILSVLLLCLAFQVDGLVARTLTLQPSTLWRPVALYASKAGEGWVVGVAGILGSLGLFLARKFHASRGVFLTAFTGLLTGATATILRSLLGRTRPDSHELQGFYGVWHDSHWIIGRYEFGAFPSGHVATVIGLATAAWLIDRRFGLLAIGYALLVSWSRIALGCHHFSDEMAAAIVGVYGAQVIVCRLGPSIHNLAQRLQEQWLKPKGALVSDGRGRL